MDVTGSQGSANQGSANQGSANQGSADHATANHGTGSYGRGDDGTVTLEDAFRSPGDEWHPVSPRLATGRRLVLAVVLAVPALAAVVLAVLGEAVAAAVTGAVVAVVLAWGWWLIGRRVRAYGYAERADDLLVASGILVRRLVVVPYGRMQLVDLTSGPIDRALGVATVQLHTAAATTDATIPGLPPEEAAALRDRLAARGEQRSAGL